VPQTRLWAAQHQGQGYGLQDLQTGRHISSRFRGHWRCHKSGVGQDRMYTLCMSVNLASSVPKIPCVHRTYTPHVYHIIIYKSGCGLHRSRVAICRQASTLEAVIGVTGGVQRVVKAPQNTTPPSCLTATHNTHAHAHTHTHKHTHLWPHHLRGVSSLCMLLG